LKVAARRAQALKRKRESDALKIELEPAIASKPP
jgi:hypothetical protein